MSSPTISSGLTLKLNSDSDLTDVSIIISGSGGHVSCDELMEKSGIDLTGFDFLTLTISGPGYSVRHVIKLDSI